MKEYIMAAVMIFFMVIVASIFTLYGIKLHRDCYNGNMGACIILHRSR